VLGWLNLWMFLNMWVVQLAGVVQVLVQIEKLLFLLLPNVLCKKEVLVLLELAEGS
jgi:hypothetical protein